MLVSHALAMRITGVHVLVAFQPVILLPHKAYIAIQPFLPLKRRNSFRRIALSRLLSQEYLLRFASSKSCSIRPDSLHWRLSSITELRLRKNSV